MEQLLLHLIGDYITQSDWMALNKTKNSFACLCHVTLYSIPFYFIASWKALIIIYVTHFFIDRFRLARYVVFIKNFIGDKPKWSDCQVTGYPSDRPLWMTVWLMIVADNILHLSINYLSLRYL